MSRALPVACRGLVLVMPCSGVTVKHGVQHRNRFRLVVGRGVFAGTFVVTRVEVAMGIVTDENTLTGMNNVICARMLRGRSDRPTGRDGTVRISVRGVAGLVLGSRALCFRTVAGVGAVARVVRRVGVVVDARAMVSARRTGRDTTGRREAWIRLDAWIGCAPWGHLRRGPRRRSSTSFSRVVRRRHRAAGRIRRAFVLPPVRAYTSGNTFCARGLPVRWSRVR